MPPRRRVGRPRKRNMHGRGFFGDIGNAFKSAASKVGGVVKSGINFIKDNKLASRGLGLLSRIAPPQYQAPLASAGLAAGTLGYGRHRKRRAPRRMIGRGVVNF